jgi:hypothetical protein
VDNYASRIIDRSFLFLTIILLVNYFAPSESVGQTESNQKSYELLPAPDAWYNSVDGVRIGGRLLGQVPGTFGDGPHRLKAGLWLGTKLPDHPVSYYFQFTEPISSISDFGSEANVALESYYRTGFQGHNISFNKRWQTGFDEQNYKELSITVGVEDRFDSEYLFYQQLWQNEWLYLVSANIDITNHGILGRYGLQVSADANVAGEASSFLRTTLDFQQRIKLSDSFTVNGRLFTGLATNNTVPEYLYAQSFKSPRFWMDNGLTRARGTIPPNWMGIGNIQVTGGANLRGYLKRDIQSLNQGLVPLFTSLSAVNLEVDYPNPLDKAISNIPVLGGIMKLSSYLFFDSATSLGITNREQSKTLSDAGLGFMFSFNIPDYLGKSRGIAIRYDLPLWLSHPGSEDHFKFRNVIGLGAVISL